MPQQVSKQYLHQYDWCLCSCIPGWHPSVFWWSRATHGPCLRSAHPSLVESALCPSWQVWVPLQLVWVPRVHVVSQQPLNGTEQNPSHPGVRTGLNLKGPGYNVFPWVHQFLPSFHLWVLRNHSTAYVAHPERCPMELFWQLPAILRKIEGDIHHSPSAHTLDPRHPNHGRNWRFGLCISSSVVHPNPGQQLPPSGVPLSDIQRCQSWLWHSWQRTHGHLQWATKPIACLEVLDCASNIRYNKYSKIREIFWHMT